MRTMLAIGSVSWLGSVSLSQFALWRGTLLLLRVTAAEVMADSSFQEPLLSRYFSKVDMSMTAREGHIGDLSIVIGVRSDRKDALVTKSG